MGPAGIACQGYMGFGGKNPATGLEATAAERVMFGVQAVFNGMGLVGVTSAGSGVAVQPSTSVLVSGETKVVGTGAAAANDGSFAVLSSGASAETKIVGGEAAAANDEAFTAPLVDGSGAKGVLRIDPNGSFTQSEINSAYYMAAQGKKVELRSPVGTRAEGNTSDLLVTVFATMYIRLQQVARPE